MKASDAVAQLIAYKNVSYGFELIGGMITHLVDSIKQLGKTQLYSMHHEQGAAFAAGAIARATGNKSLGVALGTSGPGATNLVTGIADCWFDNVPCLFLTGQVNTSEAKGERRIKQQGFQELDIIAIVSSITKYAKKINTVDELLPELAKAIDIAREGRPGPVLLDIPMNIQREFVTEAQLAQLMTQPAFNSSAAVPSNELISVLQERLAASTKPLVLLGGGAINDDLLAVFLNRLHELNVPYVASLKGSENIVQTRHYLGMIGSYGKRVANYALQNCDLLIVLGSRLDVRQTGSDCNDFAKNACIIQVDIDEHQLNNRVCADYSWHTAIDSFYQQFLALPIQAFTRQWFDELQAKNRHYHIDEYPEFHLSPFALFSLINEKFKRTAVQFVADVGNNQMWAAHNLELEPGQKIHYSGGLGTMGFAIPTSVGVHCATGSMVVSLSGDGGAQLNIQELDIIAREKLPILTLILNNKSLGMVKNFQDIYFDGRNDSTYWHTYSCDFVQLAKGYNQHADNIRNLAQLSDAIDYFILHQKPMLLEIDMDHIHECRPRLAFGDKLDSQSPKLLPDTKSST